MGFAKYLKETKAEMMHVNWPNRKETAIYTLLVIAVSAVVAIYLGVFDYLFTNLLSKFI